MATFVARAVRSRQRRLRDTAEIESDAVRAQIESRNAERHFAFMVRPSGYPVTWNHPQRSTKRIAAEHAFEKAVYNKRVAR